VFLAGQKTPKVEIDKRLREKSYGNMEGMQAEHLRLVKSHIPK